MTPAAASASEPVAPAEHARPQMRGGWEGVESASDLRISDIASLGGELASSCEPACMTAQMSAHSLPHAPAGSVDPAGLMSRRVIARPPRAGGAEGARC
jgi:hypothetical protein